MFAGIDIGSVTSKAVIIDDNSRIVADNIRMTGYDAKEAGRDVLKKALHVAGLSPKSLVSIVSTGYGRRTVNLSKRTVPEILCHAKGTQYLMPNAHTNIDIGGQDSKIIELDDEGNILTFAMNDKCAAGTGRFLEVLSKILSLRVEELGQLSLRSKKPSMISSTCTVFAESEIVTLLMSGEAREDIVAGMHKAIAKRVVTMGRSTNIEYVDDIIFTGGVAKNVGVHKALEEEIGRKIVVPEEPQIVAALGAAIFASTR